MAMVAEADWVSIRVQDPDGSVKSLISVTSDGGPHQDIPERGGVSAQSIELDEPIVVNDYESHPSALPSQIADGTKSVFMLPINSAEESFTIVAIVSNETEHFDP